MKVEIEDNKLCIEIDIEPAISKSGKNITIATTHGNIVNGAEYDGKIVM